MSLESICQSSLGEVVENFHFSPYKIDSLSLAILTAKAILLKGLMLPKK
jgi:hypothetical protein